jgi:hypothetical protein
MIACDVVTGLLKKGEVKEAAAKLQAYYREIGEVERLGEAPFDFERSSWQAVQRYQERVAQGQPKPAQAIQIESNKKIILHALQQRQLEGLREKLGSDYYFELIGWGRSSEEAKRLAIIRHLALTTEPSDLAGLKNLLQELAGTDRELYKGMGSGWEWEDAQDIDYTISAQEDKNRARAFAVIAQKLIENGSAEAFSLLARSIQMLPLVDHQTIMRDDHGAISYYSYVYSDLLGSGGRIKDNVAKRIMHIVSQTISAGNKVLASARNREEANTALAADIHLSRLSTFLGLFFSREYRAYRLTDKAIELVRKISVQLEIAGKSDKAGSNSDRLLEMASLLKSLAESFKKDAQKPGPEEERIISRLGELWGGDIRQSGSAVDPNKLLNP